MESHLPQQEKPKQTGSHRFRAFIPILILGLSLPMLAFMANQSTLYSFFSRAQTAQDMRIWIEPSTVVGSVGQTLTFKVMAAYEDDTKLIESAEIPLLITPDAEISPKQLVYSKPFRGRVVLGTVEVTPTEPGSYTLTTSQERVVIKSTLPVPANIQPATILVKN